MPAEPPTAPAFSVITICRNEANGIERTCKSITSQTHSDLEWILIDGASTDGTLQILDNYRDQITHLVSEPDDGIYEAMNKGLNLARGEYVVFMNGGDSFASAEVMEWVTQAPKVDLIYGQLLLDHEDGRLLDHPELLESDFLLKFMLPHQATFIRRSLFDRLGPFDTRYQIAGDYDFFCRALIDGRADYHHIAKPLAIFDRSGISNQNDHRERRKRENHQIRMQYFPKYRHSSKAWRQRLRNLFTSTSRFNS